MTATILGSPCLAAGEHDRARALVESYVRAQTSGLPGSVEITVGGIDSRARMPACRDLQTFLPPGGRLWGPSNVGVRCTQPESWSVYIPVTVRVTGVALVTTRAFAPGHRLATSDFVLRTEELTRLPPTVLVDPQAALGQVLASAVAGGVALRAEHLKQPWAVAQGQSVRLLFETQGVRVTAEGKALGNAAPGHPVDVRTASGKVVRGIAREPGVVLVH